jgi:methylated-DNA-[protein]-cysteine S-methyltransferase
MTGELHLNYGIIETEKCIFSFAWDERGVVYFASFRDEFEECKSRMEKAWGKNVKLVRTEIIPKIGNAIKSYLNGDFKGIEELETKINGTTFQLKSWQVLQTIPFGETISYQEQARRVGNIKAVRAIGGANNANLIPILIPCHRVIGKNGKMVGFGGGIDNKIWLLDHERSYSKLG